MKTPENKGSDSESSRNGTIQNVASDDEFIDALEDLVKTLRNGSLNHASFSAVHFSREVPEGDSVYMGSSFIIHSGTEDCTG